MSIELVGIFSAGLLTFVTPCVLPLVPIYLAALAGGDFSQLSSFRRGQLLTRAGLFAVGFIAVFTLMGVAASSVGALLITYRLLVQTLGAMLILLFALKFLGVIQVPLFDRVIRGNDAKLKTRVGSVNALVMGVIFAVGWSPCVGPVLGSVLTFTASTTSDPWTGAGYLATYGVGFALPLLVTAAFAEAIGRLWKRLSPQLPRIEKAIGVLLLVVAGALVYDAQPAAPSLAPLEANVAELAAVEQQPRMVELYLESCPICQEMIPVVDSVAEACAGHEVAIEQIDLSLAQNRHLAAQHRVVGVPTFLFLDSSEQEVARLVGRQTEETLRQALSALTGESCPGVGPVPTVEAGRGGSEDMACPSTSLDVQLARNASKPSSDSHIAASPSLAPSATNHPGACTPVLP